jgi:predicted adenine nucleotide alpha hydrolase (AANH) superfamily ATPase
MEGRRPVLYYSNSNICTPEEYEKRLESVRNLAGKTGMELIIDPYDHENWLEAAAGLEDEPEGGRRCARCFRFSLSRTFVKAQELGVRHFTTTLTISPHKNSKLIFSIGLEIAAPQGKPPGVQFLEIDFKKQGGFQRSVELSKEHGLYRQNFCGCEFSLR